MVKRVKDAVGFGCDATKYQATIMPNLSAPDLMNSQYFQLEMSVNSALGCVRITKTNRSGQRCDLGSGRAWIPSRRV